MHAIVSSGAGSEKSKGAVWFGISKHYIFSGELKVITNIVCVCVFVCVCARTRACVCTCARATFWSSVVVSSSVVEMSDIFRHFNP